jgi:hypothetical protein
LYQHLVEVINHIILHCPDKGLDQFEEISYLLKNKEDINIKDFLQIEDDRYYSIPQSEQAQLMAKFIAKIRKVFDVTSLI